MNIAFVNPEYPSLSGHDQGGIATYTYSMALACAELGHRVHILVKCGTIINQCHRGVILHEFTPIPFGGPFRLLSRALNGNIFWEREYSTGLRQLLLAIHGNDPLDIVEVPEYNGLASELRPPFPFPVVVHFHTPTVLVDFYNAIKINRDRTQWYTFEKKACLHANAYRCPSMALAKEINKRYGIAENRITLIRHPFDTALFDTIVKSRSSDHVDMLFVGRLERRKGAEILLKNIQRILSLDNRLRLTFAGEFAIGNTDMYRSAIERSLSESDRKRVWFLGPTKREKLPVLYCRSNMICIPSLFENAPYTLLEAVAAKLPVIGANTGGIPELIRHGESGMLFDPDSSDDLVACIQFYLDKPALAETFAQNAYTTMVKEFHPDKIARKVIEFYNSVISSLEKK
jgi:glycogen synthase